MPADLPSDGVPSSTSIISGATVRRCSGISVVCAGGHRVEAADAPYRSGRPRSGSNPRTRRARPSAGSARRSSVGARPGLLDPIVLFSGSCVSCSVGWAMGVELHRQKHRALSGARATVRPILYAVERVAILAPVWMRWRPGFTSVILVESCWVGYARSRLRRRT